MSSFPQSIFEPPVSSPNLLPESLLAPSSEVLLEMYPPHQLRVYTDGSFLGGIKQAGWAYVVTTLNRTNESPLATRSGPVSGQQTNNRAELTAVLQALIDVRLSPLNIYSDSRYTINCLTIWPETWQRNGWRTSKRTPVRNQDLISAILAHQSSGRIIYSHHFPSH